MKCHRHTEEQSIDEIAQQRSLLASIVCDNGPELTSKAMFFWVSFLGH